MYSNGNRDRIRRPSKNEDIVLPELPPLNTNNPFLDNSLQHGDEVSIGWTPVEERHNHQQEPQDSQKRYSFPGNRHLPQTPPRRNSKDSNSITSPTSSSTSRRHSARRPPPPPIPQAITSPTNSVASSRIYKSPFVGEAAIKCTLSPEPRVYRSPFVGEPVLAETAHMATSPAQRSFEDMPYVTFNNVEFSKRALPPLPTSTSENDNLNIFNVQPPPVLGGVRHTSNNSRLSDSLGSYYSDSNYAFNGSSARHNSFGSVLGGKPLDQVPSITAPTQPFSIDSLDENKLYQCYSVYRLSDIYEWILKVYFEWFNEYIFGKIEFFQMVQLLLEFQMPKSFDQDTIDSNVDRIIESLVAQNAVRFEQDGQSVITIIVAGLDVNGIFTQLLPCYSFLDTTLAPSETSLCYSLTCVSRQPNEREEIKLSEIINNSVGVWTDYWKLSQEDISEINPREVQRQSFIFDLIILEERSLNMANAAVEIYGKSFDPSLLPDEPDFAERAFDIFLPLIRLHKEFLLGPILWKLKTRGKFIDGVGKIYLKWCNEAHDIYLRYASDMATVHAVITSEKAHDTKFAHWLRAIDNLPEISRSKMYHDVIFFGGFFKSLQNLPITLNSILKNTEPSSEDYEYLKLVIKEVEKLSAEVNRVHGLAIDRRTLVRFSKQLVFRSTGDSNTVGYVNLATNDEEEENKSSQDRLDLGLANPERKMLMTGMAMKKRELWLEPTPVYIVLLDNYFLITEAIIKGNQKRYKLAERPIPIDYLSLEERRKFEHPQSAGSSMKDLAPRDSTSSNMSPMTGIRPNLISAASSVSRSIYNPANNERKPNLTEISNANPEAPDMSFKVRNTATNESFTFITTTPDECQRWKLAVLDCFRRSSYANNCSGFELQVLTTQFAFAEKEAPVNLPVAPEGSVIDVALREYEKSKCPPSVVRPTLNFSSLTLVLEGKMFLILATDYGVHMRNESDHGQEFVKVLQSKDVRRMEVNLRLGLLFVLDGRLLCYFSISSIMAAYYSADKRSAENRIVGVVVSDKVGCFKFAEDFGNSRQLLYERKGRIFVMTPEYDRMTKVLKYFKTYKEYKLSSLNSSLSTLDVVDDIIVFRKCFIVCTSKGCVVYHDAFNDDGISIPTFTNDQDVTALLKHPHLSSNPFRTAIESSSKKDSSKQKMAEYVKKDIATSKTKPITCFQISLTNGYLVVYDEAVIRVDRQGQIANWKLDILVLDFYCTGASFHKGYLTLIGDSLVQVYRINDSEVSMSKLVPIQIIKGKKVRLVNSDRNGEPVVALSHPSLASRQLLVALKPR